MAHLARALPPWIDPRFARAHSLELRDRIHAPRITRGSRADRETVWYLSHQYFPRVFGAVSTFAKDEGVEIRSPLYDKRVIELALTRPREERSSGAETKKLLRAAMRGLLPDSILAPRTKRTGVTEGYFARSMREQLPTMVDAAFDHSFLESVGVIDALQYRRAVSEYARGVQSKFSVSLYFTLQSELWLRSHVDAGTSSALLETPSLDAAVRAEQ
jgi:asparagine synthetase B (glutamine-hydrolysing)